MCSSRFIVLNIGDTRKWGEMCKVILEASVFLESLFLTNAYGNMKLISPVSGLPICKEPGDQCPIAICSQAPPKEVPRYIVSRYYIPYR
jgi:hypothetical protein